MSRLRSGRLDRLVDLLADRMIEQKEELGRIDGAIGDGDHGINMAKGFMLARERLRSQPEDSDEALNVLAKTLMTKIGGSMGPLYGYFFQSMSTALGSGSILDSAVFERMLRSGKEGIERISSAQPGDKTLLDCLVPAVEAFCEGRARGHGFDESLSAMVVAARKGRDATIDMAAKVGRASRLGERSRGVADAGASSCCIILEAMAEYCLGALSQETSGTTPRTIPHPGR
jgi:dihydroxyacetone kinase-like protein